MKMPWEIDDESNPLTPVPRLDGNTQTAPISEPALNVLARSRPDLVEAYRAKMSGSSAALQEAQKKQDEGNLQNTFGKALNDFGNSQKKNVVLSNRLQDLGKTPTIIRPDRPEYDPSLINNITQQGVDRANQQRATDRQDFGEETALTDLGDKRGRQAGADAAAQRRSDPNSAESQHARAVLAQVAPGATKIKGFETMTAAQAEAAAPELMKRFDMDQKDKFHRDDLAQRSLDRAAMLDGKRSDRADAKALKDEEYQSTVKIPGMSVTPGFKPNAASATKVRAAKTASDDLQGSINALDELYKRSGTNLVGDDAARQAQIVASMKTKLKDLESLGALSGSDYALLDNQLPDPTSIGQNVAGMFGADRYQAKSDQFKKSLANSLNSTATNNGYTVDQSGGTSEDEQAAAWAKANPNDPRAAAILNHLGGK